MTLNDTALIIFIRNPQIGVGKTRLAASVGPQKAFDIYLELLEATRDLALSFSGPRYLFYTDFVDNDDEWENHLFHKYVQVEGDLGQKMRSAFDEVLSEYQSALIIGSDCPAMDITDLDSAANALHQNDLVIGPSEDGGYYLLGMKNAHHSLFEDIPWSSTKTYIQTIRAADQLSVSVYHLRTLNDIDTIEDWLKYQKESK